MNERSVILCPSVLDMLQQMAEALLMVGRTLRPALQGGMPASILVGLWQAPGLCCSLRARMHPHDIPPPQQYLLLSAWPLCTHNAPLLSDPDVAPQVAVRIGLGELDEAERYPVELGGLVDAEAWDAGKHPRSMIRTVVSGERDGCRRDKRDVIPWHFPPVLGDSFLEAHQRRRREGDMAGAQQLKALYERWKPKIEAYRAIWEPNCRQTVYIHPEVYDPSLVTLLLTVILRQAGVIPHAEEKSLDTHAVQYLKSLPWAKDGRAYFFLLRNMAGNETWKALRHYIKRAARGLALNAFKEDISPDRIPQFVDEAQGVYNPYWVAQDIGISKKTIDRRMQEYGWPDIREEQFAFLQQRERAKQERKHLREKGKALGMSNDSIERALKADRRAGKTQQELEAAIERNAARQRRKKGEALVSLEDIPSRTDLIAEAQARFLEEPPRSEGWADAWDILRQLQQSQQGSDTEWPLSMSRPSEQVHR